MRPRDGGGSWSASYWGSLRASSSRPSRAPSACPVQCSCSQSSCRCSARPAASHPDQPPLQRAVGSGRPTPIRPARPVARTPRRQPRDGLGPASSSVLCCGSMWRTTPPCSSSSPAAVLAPTGLFILLSTSHSRARLARAPLSPSSITLAAFVVGIVGGIYGIGGGSILGPILVSSGMAVSGGPSRTCEHLRDVHRRGHHLRDPASEHARVHRPRLVARHRLRARRAVWGLPRCGPPTWHAREVASDDPRPSGARPGNVVRSSGRNLSALTCRDPLGHADERASAVPSIQQDCRPTRALHPNLLGACRNKTRRAHPFAVGDLVHDAADGPLGALLDDPSKTYEAMWLLYLRLSATFLQAGRLDHAWWAHPGRSRLRILHTRVSMGPTEMMEGRHA